jgi:hypothetical protein
VPLCHYTNALSDIIVTDRLLGSSGTTGVFGDGVYFTSLPPSTGKKKDAVNNWDGIWKRSITGGFMGGVIKIGHPNHEFESVGESNCRDVWLYRHDYLDLTTVKWAAFEIEWENNHLKKLRKIAGNSEKEAYGF